MKGHLGSVWCLAISNNGGLLVSGSQDKSLRIWRRTEEQLFLEEERDKMLDSMFEQQDMNKAKVRQERKKERKKERKREREREREISFLISFPFILSFFFKVNDETELETAGKKTMESLKAGEKLMEAIALATEDVEAMNKYKQELEEYEEQKKAVAKFAIETPMPPMKPDVRCIAGFCVLALCLSLFSIPVFSPIRFSSVKRHRNMF
jgi:U3 small nucleolar RNA-associated protein 12